MKYIYAVLIAIFLVLNLTGCASSVHIPRDSFVKISAEFLVAQCVDDSCLSDSRISTASGVIVDTKLKTYILTAGHVCDIDYAKMQLDATSISATYYVQDVAGISWKAKVYRLDRANDMCLLVTQRLGHRPIDISRAPPVYGEKYYNLAGPAGIAGKTFVPVLEGRYSGFNQYSMLFTIPAQGGSSGSPIFDKDGKLVGMIMSVHRKFPMVSFSPHFHAIHDLLKGIE